MAYGVEMYYIGLAVSLFTFSYVYMFAIWRATDSSQQASYLPPFAHLLQMPNGFKKSGHHIRSGNSSHVICSSNDVEEWSKEILDRFSIKCGLQGLRQLALELSVGIGRRDKAHRALTSKLLNLHAALKQAYSVADHAGQLTSSQVKLSSRTSLAFLKAYKVGGTHISSLLATYAYRYNLNIDPQWSYKTTSGKKYDSCVDVAGTHHPSLDFYESAAKSSNEEYFCTSPHVFMFVRDPIERIWSAYNHYRLFYSTTLYGFLKTNHNTLIPPHQLLSTNFHRSVQLANNITILSADDMDTSLVLLAKNAGMSFCDILTAPCSKRSNTWGVSKCNDRKLVLSDKMAALISQHFQSTNEWLFYSEVMVSFRKKAMDNDIKEKVKQYLSIRKKALKVCSSDLSFKAFETVFYADPNLKLVSPGSQWVLKGEDYYQIVPTWLCMQLFCRESGESFL